MIGSIATAYSSGDTDKGTSQSVRKSSQKIIRPVPKRCIELGQNISGTLAYKHTLWETGNTLGKQVTV